MARNGAILLVVIVCGLLGSRRGRTTDAASDEGSYLNEWAVHIPGGHDVAQRVANELGYINRGQVSSFIIAQSSSMLRTMSFTVPLRRDR